MALTLDRDTVLNALRVVNDPDLRKDIVRTLEAYFQSPAADTIFQERYVTVRHGRFVLPVAAGAKSRLRGIVHDRSQSGATLFVEPEGVVEANNELVQAIREDQWALPTPCTDWSVRDLVNHVVGEDAWTGPLVRGSTIEEVGDRFYGDLLGDESVAQAR